MSKPRKVGDVCRKRRLYGSDEQCQWYAYYRSIRFSRRLGLGESRTNERLQQLVQSYGK